MTVQQLIDSLSELPRDWKVVDRAGAEVDKVSILHNTNISLSDLTDVVLLDTSTSWC